jgi:flagellar M-ring protein FliF
MANEIVPQQSLLYQLHVLSHLPWFRQMGVLIGLAASVAIGVAVVLWSQTPGFHTLYANLEEKDQAAIVEELQKQNIQFKVDAATGALMVPEKDIHEVRLKLAAQGLPKGANSGFEAMDEKNTFGSSTFMENARYQHALEGELARSVMTINNVQSARVHLAVPRQSVFVRNRQQPTASVLVNLYQGRNLEEGQISAIVHLVASSVPNLDASRVTIVDQKGRLLTKQEGAQEFELSASKLDYTHRIEESYARRIESLLTPIIGQGGVRAQVAADIDFTISEETQENFKPDPSALRSEQVSEDRTLPGAGVAGIPGALSNQPPGAVSVPETTAKPAVAKDAKGGKNAKPADKAPPETASAANTSRRSTRNFELDKTISHTQVAPGKIKRLSVAVVMDDKQTLNADGEAERKSLTPEEITMVTGLVKEVIGFSAERGDTVQVINKPFTAQPAPEPLPETALWEKPWLWDLGKQALGGVLVLVLIFFVLRPMLRGLASQPIPASRMGMAPPSFAGGGVQHMLPAGGPQGYEATLTTAKAIATEDPKRAAQVVKNWVGSDA